jgi:hypothetical protein
MSGKLTRGFRLHVLNPGGRDPEQHFATSAAPDARAHAPVNFHGYAACTGGSFFREAARAVERREPVLLLLRGAFRESERALNFLKKAGLSVAVSLKETGLHQIANQLSDAGKLDRFERVVKRADGCIATTPEAADIYRAVRDDRGRVAFIATPYPVTDPQWDFSRPVEQRDGIFLGTREFDVPSRNHIAALFTAREISNATGARVTVFNLDGRKGDRLLEQIGFAPDRLRVINASKSYVDYLRLVAEHRFVLQMDTSFVPGQVAGDALLCRMPCVGGNGAIDRIGHARTCGAGRFGAELVELAMRLLDNPEFYAETTAESQRVAAERLSFAAVAEQLSEFFASLRSIGPQGD